METLRELVQNSEKRTGCVVYFRGPLENGFGFSARFPLKLQKKATLTKDRPI